MRPIRWLWANRKWMLVALIAVGVLVPTGILVVPDWFWHPVATQDCKSLYKTTAQIRDCKSYNWHSGLGSDLSEITLLVGVVVFWLKHNCYEHGCPWIGRVKGDDGHVRCKRHHKSTHPQYVNGHT